MKDARIAYGTHCLWWDNIQNVGIGFKGLPCCPHCKGLLFEVPNMDEWNKGIDEYELSHPGYRELLTWMKGKCFKSLDEAKKQRELESNIPR